MLEVKWTHSLELFAPEDATLPWNQLQAGTFSVVCIIQSDGLPYKVSYLPPADPDCLDRHRG